MIRPNPTQMDDLEDMMRCVIVASEESKGIVHPLRKIVDGRKMPTNPDKELLNLSIGKLGVRQTGGTCHILIT